MNKVEAMKSVKDGLEVLQDVPEYAAAGWESIPVEERDRLKWAGVFFPSANPGPFHDARAHYQRLQQLGSVPGAGGYQR